MFLNKLLTFVKLNIIKMADQLTILTQQVANLTTAYNQLITQARSIPELPPQTPLYTGSLLQAYNGSISQKITVQQIIDAALSVRQNQLLSIGTITVAGNDLTIPAGATWLINNTNYSNPSNIVINVPYAEDGNTRTDIIVADELNNMYRVNGPETGGVSPAPNVPLNTVLVTTVNVTDSTVGNTPPIIGDMYELVSNKATDFSIVNDELYPSVKASKDYTDSVVIGIWRDRGNYNPNANSNLYPNSGGSGTSGAIRKGDTWMINGLGVGVTTSIGTKIVQDGDVVRALINTPGNTDSNWAIAENNVGYVPANDANVIHNLGNETFSGLKSGTSNGATATTGFHFLNNYNGGLAQLGAPFRVVVANNGLGYAGQNDGAGTLFLGFNTSTGSLNRWDSATGSTGDLLRMSKNSVLTAFINHLGELTVPKINVTGETASTIAGFDSFKNIFSLPTATYPSLTELAFLKGVTSSIQAQINAKQNTLTNPVTGLGTTNYIPKFTGTGSQAISQFFDNGTMVGIGTNSPNYLITSYMTGNNYFQWTNANTGTGGLDGLLVGVDTLSAVQIINRENTIMSFWCNNAIIQRLFPSGGVSIGSTTDPGANNFSVAGSITATTYAGTATLTGTPTAPTATVGTNTTQIATTAFVQANARPYKVYTALLTQTGTSAPTATILENTLGGVVVWTRTGAGIYIGTLTGAFTVNKTAGLMSDGLVTCKKAHKSTSVNVYQINTLDASTLVASDNQMSLDTIEIRVYN